jgi:hypothetical protein
LFLKVFDQSRKFFGEYLPDFFNQKIDLKKIPWWQVFFQKNPQEAPMARIPSIN